MLDFIMAVNHPQHWHAINLTQNPSHYSSGSRWLGSGMIERVQRMGAGIWYLPYVKIGDEVSQGAKRMWGKRWKWSLK